MRGVYPPASSHYSQDIKDVIAKLLAVNPSHRPSVDDILKMPQVRALYPPPADGAALIPCPCAGCRADVAASAIGNGRASLYGAVSKVCPLRSSWDDPRPAQATRPHQQPAKSALCVRILCFAYTVCSCPPRSLHVTFVQQPVERLQTTTRCRSHLPHSSRWVHRSWKVALPHARCTLSTAGRLP